MPLDKEDPSVATQLAVLTEKIENQTSLILGVKEAIDKHEIRIHDLELNYVELRSHVNTFALIQAAFTAVASAVSAFLGVSH